MTETKPSKQKESNSQETGAVERRTRTIMEILRERRERIAFMK